MYESRSTLFDYIAYYIDVYSEYPAFRVVLVFFDLFWQYLPYIIASILVSSLIARYLRPEKLQKTFTYNRFWSILLASLLGTISPLSSYALIPFAGSLLLLGFPLGPVSAFIFSTPLMNPTIFILTLRGLGLKMALARTISTILIGIASGYLSEMIFRHVSGLKEDPKFKLPKTKAFLPYVLSMAKYMSKAFFIALFLASLVRVFLKPEQVAGLLGPDKPWSISVAALLGVPFYTCGGATIPVVSSLIDLGMSHSAGLAFFIAGPATNLPNVSAVLLTFKWQYLVFYLLLTLLLAIGCGYVFSIF